jgi:poly(3-hydroxybutyrate) depolymerase
MMRRRSYWAALFAVGALAVHPLSAEVTEKTRTIAGLSVTYKVVLPNGYDPSKAYPAVLAFSGGSQAENTVQMDLRRNWREQAERRGYIVVIAAAPNGQLFFEGGDRIFPEFFRVILNDYKILDGKFHVAGPSNGGISAFFIAARYPQYFVSVTGFPGYLPDATPARIKALSPLCIYMFAGEQDREWSSAMEQQSKAFQAQGLTVRTSVEKGQPHLIGTLAGDGASRLFDQFDQSRVGCAK